MQKQNSLRNLPRNVWVVMLTSFLTDISSEMLVNLIPFFLANVLGVRTAVIGLIDGIAETTASLMKIISGVRRGHVVTLSGYLVMATNAKGGVWLSSMAALLGACAIGAGGSAEAWNPAHTIVPTRATANALFETLDALIGSGLFGFSQS